MQRTLVSELDSKTLIQLQTNLKKLGYYNDKIDGIYGRNTGEGFAKWKADNWLEETTYIGESSFNQLQDQANAIKTINWSDFNCKVSKYFTVGEVTQNDKHRIPTNTVHQKNIMRIAAELDKLREEWGNPIGVTSWYRPPFINAAVKGAKNSQHLNGGAVDIYPIGGDIYKFQKWLDKRWNMAMGYGAPRFIHLDLRAPGQRIRWNY